MRMLTRWRCQCLQSMACSACFCNAGAQAGAQLCVLVCLAHVEPYAHNDSCVAEQRAIGTQHSRKCAQACPPMYTCTQACTCMPTSTAHPQNIAQPGTGVTALPHAKTPTPRLCRSRPLQRLEPGGPVCGAGQPCGHPHGRLLRGAAPHLADRTARAAVSASQRGSSCAYEWRRRALGGLWQHGACCRAARAAALLTQAATCSCSRSSRRRQA